MVIDSHCHLDFPQLNGELDAILARARDAGVGLMVTISTRVAKFGELKAIVEAHDNVYCSIGTHPHNAAEEPDITVEELVEISRHPKVVAIGEAGLDYHYDHSPRDVQKKSFRTHIAAARETGLPLVIHAREADTDVARILEEESTAGAFPFVLHCFTSGADLAHRGLALGGYISFSGVVTFKKSDALRDIALAVPYDRILVETDAPYLAPEPYRGKTNEPSYVVKTAARLAELRGASEEDFARTTSENFFRLFNKVPPVTLRAQPSAA
jgi:TatD DNase family protein